MGASQPAVSSSGTWSKRIFFTGGTGFVGSRVVSTLNGHSLRLLVRDSDSGPPQSETIEKVVGDVTDPNSLRGAIDGCDTVVHLVAVIEEHGNATFDRVIRQGTENVIEEAQRAGVKHFVQMSALGAQNDPRYGYHTAKWQAEQTLKASGLPYTIFRPSVIFGPGDGFISVLAGVVRVYPITPVVGDGQTKFQPVYIQDVADAFKHVVENPEESRNQTYELGGARVYTYEEMLDILANKLGKKRPKAHLPVPLMQLVVRAAAPLPKAIRPPVTTEQLKMLSLDNSTADSATGRLIGRQPLPLEDGIDYIQTR